MVFLFDTALVVVLQCSLSSELTIENFVVFETALDSYLDAQ